MVFPTKTAHKVKGAFLTKAGFDFGTGFCF